MAAGSIIKPGGRRLKTHGASHKVAHTTFNGTLFDGLLIYTKLAKLKVAEKYEGRTESHEQQFFVK